FDPRFPFYATWDGMYFITNGLQLMDEQALLLGYLLAVGNSPSRMCTIADELSAMDFAVEHEDGYTEIDVSSLPPLNNREVLKDQQDRFHAAEMSIRNPTGPLAHGVELNNGQCCAKPTEEAAE